MRIGLFGGSFNPIHTGHAIIASYVLQNTDIDSLWFLVTPGNPLKDRVDKAMDIHRLKMVELVSRNIDGASTSAFEFSLPQPSFTVNTLKALTQKFPDDEFVLIIGADNLAIFDRWRDHEYIVQNYDIYVYPRRGYELSISPNYTRVKAISAPLFEISSTQIRADVQSGKSVRFLVPDDVNNYIITHNLYKH